MKFTGAVAAPPASSVPFSLSLPGVIIIVVPFVVVMVP
jgi:hypothetical protein